MIQVSRAWATPLTMGVFVVMAVTGGLMFFHLDTGLNKTAHEWLGWAMVAAVAAHATANGLALKRYLLASRGAQATLGAALVLLVASFAPVGGEGASPPVLAMQAVVRTPLKQVAPLTGRSLERLRADLAAAGLTVRDGEQTLQDLTGGERARLGTAMRVLFGPAPVPA